MASSLNASLQFAIWHFIWANYRNYTYFLSQNYHQHYKKLLTIRLVILRFVQVLLRNQTDSEQL